MDVELRGDLTNVAPAVEGALYRVVQESVTNAQRHAQLATRVEVLTLLYVLIPIFMIAASLLAPARVNRVVNIIVSLLYVASIVVTTIGETWIYYILGSIIEAAILLAIAGIAWTWRARSSG